jgi:peptide/nickel transport system substrate-binding protein
MKNPAAAHPAAPSVPSPSRLWIRSPSPSRALGALAAALAAATLLAAAPAAAQLAAPREKTIIFAQPGVLNTLDPLRADYAQTNIIDNALYDTLVTFDYDKKLVGRLAASFKVADDVRSIDVTLRTGVTFHDGKALTAKDVAYTLDRLKRLGAGVASQIDGYDKTVIADDTHLTIKLSKPSSLFVAGLSKIYILNSALVAANAGSDDGQAWLQGHDAGSGPFMLVGTPNPDVQMALFKGYWRGITGRPEALVIRRIDESATRRDELRAGNVDVAISVSGRDIASLANEPGLAVAKLKVARQTEVVFNTRFGVTADKRIRRALRYAYDYAGGLAGVQGGNGSLANGVLPNTMPCRPDTPVVRRDPALAKKLLAEAGVPDLKLTMKFQPVFEDQKQEATLLQSNLREIGVTLDLEPIAFPNYLASLKNAEQIPAMMLLVDFAQVPDPGVVLIKGYKSDAVGTNRAAYANPEVDKLLDQALATADEAKRCEIYKTVQTILDDDSVMIDFYTTTNQLVYRSELMQEPKASAVVSPIEPADFLLK